ncbi:MAG TPA: tetratricopeptide repeat protein [Planctomycetota bacterium]|nr:tetratricopeptide repeat protein [Planctomycetota bacterium]
MKHATAIALLCATLATASCRGPGTSPYAPQREAARNTTRAEQINREAADLIASDPERAEALLRDALTADLFYGPAHNNLGVLYLGQGKLYEAAGEFEWARKLMPEHPDPRVNLALVLQRAGRLDDAIAEFEQVAVEHHGYLPALQGWAIALVESGQDLGEMGQWEAELRGRVADEGWAAWLREGSTVQ